MTYSKQTKIVLRVLGATTILILMFAAYGLKGGQINMPLSGNLVFASSTTKTLSTNFTLQNLGNTTATVAVAYYKPDGSNWPADAGNTTFTIPGNGGQKAVYQYFDTTLTAGRGSAVVSSDQPLGAIVQQLARGQVPTSGAYVGFTQGNSTFFLPLAIRQRNTLSGLSNSQIVVQNADSSTVVSVTVQLVGNIALGYGNFTKVFNNIPVGAAVLYDLADESSANVPDGWTGSAAVYTSNGQLVTAVSNFFQGPNTLQTYNGIASNALGASWLVPLFDSRLANGLSTVISVQNLSGGSMAAGAIQMVCTRDVNLSTGPAVFTVTTPSVLANNAGYSFNPASDTTTFPSPQLDAWYGSCSLKSTGGNFAAIIQMRFIGTDNADAYLAIAANGTNHTVLDPVVAKRLSNGFATVLTVQNLSAASQAHVTFTYVPSPAYVAAGGSALNVVDGPFAVQPLGFVQHNLRLPGTGTGTGQHNLPDGWYGTATVTSSDQPINGFVQLTNYLSPPGDTFMTVNAFTTP